MFELPAFASPPVAEAANEIVYGVAAPGVGSPTWTRSRVSGVAATTANGCEPTAAGSELVDTSTVPLPAGALTSPPRETVTAVNGAIVAPPNSVHVIVVPDGLPHVPTEVAPTFTDELLYEPANPVPSGYLSVIWLFPALDSPPVADVVNRATYCDRAPAAAEGAPMSTVGRLISRAGTMVNALDVRGASSDEVETSTLLLPAGALARPPSVTVTAVDGAIASPPKSVHVIVVPAGLPHVPTEVAPTFTVAVL